MSDPIGFLRHILAASWAQLLRSPGDPDERDEDACIHLGAARWLDAAADAGDGAPAPGPSCDELAARLAERERELADVTRDRDTARRRLTAMRDAVAAVAWTGSVDNDPDAVAALDASDASDLRRIACTLAARVDPQPPQRAAGLGAGGAAASLRLDPPPCVSYARRAEVEVLLGALRAAGGAR